MTDVNADTLDAKIRALRAKAVEYNYQELIHECDAALAGDERARGLLLALIYRSGR